MFFYNIFLLDCHGFAASHKHEITDSAIRPIAELILGFFLKPLCHFALTWTSGFQSGGCGPPGGAVQKFEENI